MFFFGLEFIAPRTDYSYNIVFYAIHFLCNFESYQSLKLLNEDYEVQKVNQRKSKLYYLLLFFFNN